MGNFDIKDFNGVIPAVLTVFDKNENIDELVEAPLLTLKLVDTL